MINKLIGLAARLTIGKHIVNAVAWAHNKADGHRSEINIALIAIVHGLKIAGVIPAGTADGIETSLAAILPVTLADKVAKAKAVLDQVVPKSEPSSDKPL